MGLAYTLGTTAQIDWNLHKAHQVSTGLQILSDRMDRNTTQIGTLDPPGAAPLGPVNHRYSQRAHITTSSLYAQDTWSFAPDWKAVLGARYYLVDAGLDRSTRPTLKPRASNDGKAIASKLAPSVACPAGEFAYINASTAETYALELAGSYKKHL